MICSLQCRAGISANTCLWIPLQLDLIFRCLNLFKSFQLKSIAEIWHRNLIRVELEIELVMLGLQCSPLCENTTDLSQKGKSCVVIYFVACLSHLDRPGVRGFGFNTVKQLQIDLERLHFACSDRTSQL